MAFQLDVAVAIKGEEAERQVRKSELDYINEHILLVCQALGAKIKPKRERVVTPVPDGELRPLSEVLAQLGGPGTVVEK